MGRYLSPTAKRRVLGEWARILATSPPKQNGGSRGHSDPDIIPWCERLNALPGVCTLQSCAGHRRGRWRDPAHLWIWLDRPMSELFDRQALGLARNPLIERVERLYTSWGSEVAAITFAGNDRDLLGESMNVVLAFFESLARANATDDQ